MIVKKLSVTDIDFVEQLILQTRRENVKTRIDPESNMIILDRFLYSLTNSGEGVVPGSVHVFGAFDNNGRLLSALIQRLWKEFPIYHLRDMVFCYPGTELHDTSMQALTLCLDEAIKLGESVEFFKWYWVAELSDLHILEEYWSNNSSFFQKYITFTEGIFYKGERSRYQWKNGILNPQLSGATADLAIKFAVMKPDLSNKFYEAKLETRLQQLANVYHDTDLDEVPAAPKVNITANNIDEKEIKSKIRVTETDHDFFLQFKDLMAEGKIIVDLNGYPKYIADGEHRYFKAEIDGKLVGLSAMTLHYSSDGKRPRVYHRTAYVFPEFRRKGVWKEMMKHKIKYIVNNDWPTIGTLHTVSVAIDDYRYLRDGWKVFKYGTQTYSNNNGNDVKVGRKLWFLNWEDIKKKYLN